ncbi:MAG: rhodanese-like domain-containing protein [Beijerinckiaceae bacterium]
MHTKAIALLFAATLGSTAMAQTPTPVYPINMTPVEAAKLAQDKKVILIDIRTEEEWRETGVAENAHKIDIYDPMFVAKLSKLTGGDRSKPVALICRTANRTRTVQQALLQGGYSAVINVEGGMVGNSADQGWIRHGLPVVKSQ